MSPDEVLALQEVDMLAPSAPPVAPVYGPDQQVEFTNSVGDVIRYNAPVIPPGFVMRDELTREYVAADGRRMSEKSVLLGRAPRLIFPSGFELH